MLEAQKLPGWVRALEVIFGIASIIAGVYVLAYPGIAVLTLILLLAVGLFFLGWREILVGAMADFLPTWLRVTNIILGVLAFILAAVVAFQPAVATTTLVFILYFALFARGLAGMVTGSAAKGFPGWMRGLSVTVGILCVILAITFVAVPSLAIATLIALLSVGLLITGLEFITDSAIGRRLVLVSPGKI